jgi:hypothetical protein
LDLGLLIHTQHDRVLRRIQVQANDVGDLGDQLTAVADPDPNGVDIGVFGIEGGVTMSGCGVLMA